MRSRQLFSERHTLICSRVLLSLHLQQLLLCCLRRLARGLECLQCLGLLGSRLLGERAAFAIKVLDPVFQLLERVA